MDADNKSIKPQPQPQPPGLPFETRCKLFILKLWALTLGTRISNLFDIKAPAPATKLIKNSIRVSTSDVPIDPSSNHLWLRLFTPETTNSASPDNKSLPLIVYYHGGGFVAFGPDNKIWDDLCSHIAARVPAVVASIHYRLAPKHRCPTQYEDGFDALKFIEAQNYGFLPANTDINKCYIGGDSAGANIAHHVTIRALQNANHFKNIKLIGLLSIQPFFGGEERAESELRLTNPTLLKLKLTDFMWRSFLPEGADRNHPAVNVFGVGGKDSEAAATEMKSIDYPSTLVIVAGDDILQDWQRRYARGLKNCGKQVEVIEYPNAFHGFYLFPELPEFDMLMDNLSKFMKTQLSSS